MTPEEANLKSRIETLDELFKRFKSGLYFLDPYSAISFSSPMADCLLMAVGQLEQFKEEKKVDKLIQDALNEPTNDSPIP